MDKYRRTIKIRIALLSILAILGVAVGIIDVFVLQEKFDDNAVFCFSCGLATSLALLAAVLIARYGAALHDERKLALLQNGETDERMKAIRAKAGQPFVLIVSIILLIASIAVGYFYPIAFYTLIAVVAFQNAISAAVKFAYMKIM